MGPVDVVVCADVGHAVHEASAATLAQALLGRSPRALVFVAGTEGEGLARCGARGGAPASACGPFATEKPATWWSDVIERNESYRLDVAATVSLRNALFDDIAVMSAAYWWPKNALVFSRAGAAMKRGVPDRVLWFDRTESSGALRPELLAMLERDGSAYRDLLTRDAPADEPRAAGIARTGVDVGVAVLTQEGTRGERNAPMGLRAMEGASSSNSDSPANRSSGGTAGEKSAEGRPGEFWADHNGTGRGPEFVSTAALLQLYVDRRFDELHAALLGNLGFMAAEQPTNKGDLDDFVTTLLFMMSRPDFNVVRVCALRAAAA
jgi:hypothetical protein